MTDALTIAPDIDADDDAPRHGLWVTDAEIIRRLGVSEKVGYTAIHRLEKSGLGFPEKQRVWGKKRYWPAVKDFFDAQYGLKSGPSANRRGHE